MGRHSIEPEEPVGIAGASTGHAAGAAPDSGEPPVLMLPEAVRGAFRPADAPQPIYWAAQVPSVAVAPAPFAPPTVAPAPFAPAPVALPYLATPPALPAPPDSPPRRSTSAAIRPTGPASTQLDTMPRQSVLVSPSTQNGSPPARNGHSNGTNGIAGLPPADPPTVDRASVGYPTPDDAGPNGWSSNGYHSLSADLPRTDLPRTDPGSGLDTSLRAAPLSTAHPVPPDVRTVRHSDLTAASPPRTPPRLPPPPVRIGPPRLPAPGYAAFGAPPSAPVEPAPQRPPSPPEPRVVPAPAYWPTVPSRPVTVQEFFPRQVQAGRAEQLEHTRQRPPQRTSRLRGWLSWIAVIVVAVLVATCLRVFVVESFWIPSASMEPTLHGCSGCNNDRVLVNKTSYELHSVHRGDVIVFDKPPSVSDPDKYLIKRVIGLPGDVISGHDGKVWIDNRPLTEPYANPKCGPQASFTPSVVPAGKVFVMGDNRCDSYDSRIFGAVSESTIVGRAFMIVWPFQRRHWL